MIIIISRIKLSHICIQHLHSSMHCTVYHSESICIYKVIFITHSGSIATVLSLVRNAIKSLQYGSLTFDKSNPLNAVLTLHQSLLSDYIVYLCKFYPDSITGFFIIIIIIIIIYLPKAYKQ